jgi:hypothetical protein
MGGLASSVLPVCRCRCPQVLRATLRWLIVVVIPVAMGPVWNGVATSYHAATFAGIVGVLVRVLLDTTCLVAWWWTILWPISRSGGNRCYNATSPTVRGAVEPLILTRLSVGALLCA